MQNMSRAELLRLIDDIRERVAEGATLEGQLRFSHAGCRNDVDFYSVASIYRAGSGVHMVGVERTAIRCTRCQGEDGPFTKVATDSLCEACARPMPLDGVA
ncbi:hypothetical protein GCM10010099_22570 [Streptomyces cinereus]|nr:hypothetical protein GCM10010099_22570 [Streptomyces cinereus]